MTLSLNKKRIKRIVIKLLVFALSFLGGMMLARVTKAQDAKSLLWKIEGKELKKPSYLYGTVHLICKEDFRFDESITSALNTTEQTILEIDYDDPEFMTKMQQGSLNPGMKNISEEFTAEQKEVTNKFFKTHYGADLTQLGVVKPFGLLSMVIQKSVTCPVVESYEQTFANNAKERNVEVLGLETVEFQTTLFDQLPMEDQIELLVTSINDFEDGKEDFTKMIDAYKKQDIVALKKFMTDSPEYEKFEDLLINDRNEDWISKIEKHAKEKPTFFAVGALHLAGDNGVIKLLEKEGYKVSPVSNAVQ
ncbi:MAG: TraB/GumN family protein [Fulvivirga sp.]|uniref:TraB/GumN family protein n=1 Tax=Fulvivirga sp. TaxID=1931237 RepID=UPI0032F03E56